MQDYSNSDNSNSLKKIETATNKKSNVYISNIYNTHVDDINIYKPFFLQNIKCFWRYCLKKVKKQLFLVIFKYEIMKF